MFIEIVESETPLPDGGTLNSIGYGLLLNVNNTETPVLLKDLTDIELDDEDLEKASFLYVTFEGVTYEFPLPASDTGDWEILQEMFEPE